MFCCHVPLTNQPETRGKIEIKIYPCYRPVIVQFNPLKFYNSTRLTHKEIGCNISLWKNYLNICFWFQNYQSRELRPGMVFAIDGSVNSGNFLAQVGDSFIITEDGYEQITSSSKSLIDIVL